MSNFEYVMRMADKTARRDDRRYAVIGQRWHYAGREGWHYIAVPAVFRSTHERKRQGGQHHG